MAVTTTLAGRRLELSAVTSVLTGAEGTAAMVVVGEAGVGKSRLVAAAAGVAGQSDVMVLTGWCLPLSEQLPFLPVMDVLRELGDVDGGRLVSSLLSDCPAFVRAEVLRLMPELNESSEELRSGEPDDGWRRQRLFDALRRLLCAFAKVRQVALLVEDLHWADSTTLEFLHYLLTPGRAPCVPLLLTCRTEEEPTTRLTAWLERLARDARVRWLELSALTLAETADQIALQLGRRAPRHFVDEIYLRSEGNAFFTEQLVAFDQTSTEHPSIRDALPTGLTSLLLSRTAEVIGTGRDIMVAMAVAARPLDESSLSKLCRRDAGEVRAALRDLLSAWLLRRPDVAGRYQLRHALLAEAIRGELLPGERRELHQRVAELIAGWREIGLAGEVAAHFAEADASDEELRWRVRAGGEAEAVFAWSEGAGHWRRVISLWDRVPNASAIAGVDLAQAYLSAAASAENGGERLAAAGLVEDAVVRLAATASPATAVSLYAKAGELRIIGSLQASNEALAIAIEIGEAIPPSRDYVRALHTFARVRSDQGHPEEEHPLMTRALQAAERAGFLAEQKSLHAEMAWLAMADGNVKDAEAGFDRAAQIVLEPEDPSVEASVALLLSDVLLKLGALERVVELGVRTLESAERCGMSNSYFTKVVRCNMCEALIERGDLDRAAHIIDPVTEETPTRDFVHFYILRAVLDTRRGRLADAADFWNQHQELLTLDVNPELSHEIALTRIQLELWRNDPIAVPAEAFSILEQYCRTDAAPFAGEMFVLMLRACADAAERARATGDRALLESAVELGGRLSRLRAALNVDPFADREVPATAHADLLSWHAESGRLRGESDAAAWQGAAEAWDALNRPHRAAYARWRQAEALLGRPQGRTRATTTLRTAAAQAAQHVPLTNAIGDLARRARIELTEAEHPPHLDEPKHSPAFGLTEREVTVLRLLGEGKTNPEIGAALFISPRTASVHVTNILRKLSVTTRVQAASVAERAGLLADNRPGAKPDP